MHIFNSLGSNYSFDFVKKALLSGNDEVKIQVVTDFLVEKYGGKAFLYYKGRDALRMALRAIGKKGSVVGICGFTCYAVYQAVVEEGYTACFLDIEKDTLHFSLQELVKARKRHRNLAVLIVQNTLGYPCDISEIARYCKKEKIVLVEDLAHSIGTKYIGGKEAGTVGDLVAFSFSQDKVIDAVSGGALIIRNTQYSLHETGVKQHVLHEYRDRLYPLFTFLIRKTYGMGIGKGLHVLLKHANLLTKPMTSSKHVTSLSAWYCELLYDALLDEESNLQHRRTIAQIYAQMLPPDVLLHKVCEQIDLSTNIRFPIVIEKRDGLLRFLREDGIFLSDIWYDAPIAPKKMLAKTSYQHDCPNAENISQRILNLPTHRNVSESDARNIAELINQWLKNV